LSVQLPKNETGPDRSRPASLQNDFRDYSSTALRAVRRRFVELRFVELRLAELRLVAVRLALFFADDLFATGI
jgi:hypothetical protein